MEREQTQGAELRITPEEARSIASLLRYAVSLNTTVGLVSPTQRRLATSTYRAVELAALVLEGKPLDRAIQEADQTWTGSLAEDHLHAIQLLQTEREALRQTMSGLLTPEQLAEYLEIAQDQFLELARRTPRKNAPWKVSKVSYLTRSQARAFQDPPGAVQFFYMHYAHIYNTCDAVRGTW